MRYSDCRFKSFESEYDRGSVSFKININQEMDILELDKQFKGQDDQKKIKAILSFPILLTDSKSIDVGFSKLAEYWRNR